MAADRETMARVLAAVPQQEPFRFIDEILELPVGAQEVVVRLTGTEISLMGLDEDQVINAAQVKTATVLFDLSMSDITSRQVFRNDHATLLLAPGAARPPAASTKPRPESAGRRSLDRHELAS